MALDFSKNTSNYASFGIGTIGNLLDGATGWSMSFAIKVDSLDGGGLKDDSFYVWVTDATQLISVRFNGNRLQCDFRPTSAETTENQLGSASVNAADGNWHYQSFAFDVENDLGANWTDGLGSEGANLFTATGISAGSPSTNHDGLGARIDGAAPTDTTRMLDGQMAHVALWNVYLNRGELTSLSVGYSPLLIRPDRLLFYKPLNGTLGDGRNSANTPALSITGSVPYAGDPDHAFPASPSIA